MSYYKITASQIPKDRPPTLVGGGVIVDPLPQVIVALWIPRSVATVKVQARFDAVTAVTSWYSPKLECRL